MNKYNKRDLLISSGSYFYPVCIDFSLLLFVQLLKVSYLFNLIYLSMLWSFQYFQTLKSRNSKFSITRSTPYTAVSENSIFSHTVNKVFNTFPHSLKCTQSEVAVINYSLTQILFHNAPYVQIFANKILPTVAFFRCDQYYYAENSVQTIPAHMYAYVYLDGIGCLFEENRQVVTTNVEYVPSWNIRIFHVSICDAFII